MMHHHFPDPEAARILLAEALAAPDGAHDAGHLLRVWRSVTEIAAVEGGEMSILMAATILHDCIAVDKGSGQRGQPPDGKC